jgi:hypothetical protein
MPPEFKEVYLQDTKVIKFTSHISADTASRLLFNSISLTSKDPSYKKNILPFRNTLNTKKVQAVGMLVDDFFKNSMTKDTFKDKWRALEPGTDEHFSTQSVFMLVSSMRTKKLQGSDLTAFKDTLAVISNFRLPTEETGHLTSKNYKFAHPRGDKQSLYVHSNKSPGHSNFDLFRRTLAILVGRDERKSKGKDGTGVLLSMLSQVVKFSIHFTASPFASDVSVRSDIPSAKKQKTFNNREDKKADLKRLEGSPVQTQSRNTSQFNGQSPASRSLEPGRKRARSLSPSRSQSSASSLQPALSPWTVNKRPKLLTFDPTLSPNRRPSPASSSQSLLVTMNGKKRTRSLASNPTVSPNPTPFIRGPRILSLRRSQRPELIIP